MDNVQRAATVRKRNELPPLTSSVNPPPSVAAASLHCGAANPGCRRLSAGAGPNLQAKACATLAFFALLPLAIAQQPIPHAGYVYPAGGRQDTTFEVTVGGQFLDNVNRAIVSGAGVQATIVEHFKPLTAGQATQLRDQLKELMEKKSPAAADQASIAEIRKKLAGFIRRPTTPAIAETVRVQIALTAGAAPGERELRLATPNGLTNPLKFCIDQLPETSKARAQATGEPRGRGQIRAAAPEPPSEITLPTIVNGQITPGGVDRYRFQAVKGQRIVLAVKARELIPYISDAVPGWFQATLSLTDAKGKEVNYADHFLFHPDPVLYYEIPEDGAYTLEIHDSIYRGREDFVYRIAVGELPFITSIFPLGGKTGTRIPVELHGWNLPTAKLTEDAKGKPAGVYPIVARAGEWTSNTMPFAIDALPETAEKEPNNRKENAQRVQLPVIVNGRIDQPGDADVFRIDGRGGDELIAEVTSRRLNSPLDSLLRLTDSGGKELASNDDYEDKGAALLTHQADSRLRVKLPAGGAYYLYLTDTQGKGGPDFGYRLRISRPQPDFELRVTPASTNARAGATVPVTVYALRRDEFAGEILVKLKDAPGGFVLSGGVIPAGVDRVRLTLTMPTSPEAQRQLSLEGHATIAGRDVRRSAIPAEDMMQAFAYHHLVAAREWLAEVTGQPRPNARAAWKLESEKAVKLPVGGTASVRVALSAPRMADVVRLELNAPPNGIAIQSVETIRDGVAIVLRVDAKAHAGLKGNLIVDAFMERAAPNAPQAARRRVPLGTLPAIPFEVVGTLEARR